MTTRTWNYGSRMKAEINSIVGVCAVLTDEHGEGHILIPCHYDVPISDGDKVVIEFTNGVPTGGYWRIVAKQ